MPLDALTVATDAELVATELEAETLVALDDDVEDDPLVTAEVFAPVVADAFVDVVAGAPPLPPPPSPKPTVSPVAQASRDPPSKKKSAPCFIVASLRV
jgi:hypothetical protein